MKVQEIKKKATDMGINPGKMKKTDLIRAIQSTEGNYPCFQTATDFCDQDGCCWRGDCMTTQ
ncbi:MAG: Rho termination factor N-terminal domain-containing protein [Desulfobulbaceae bacterium]|nr:Rho termination factor N-terminal domain-containing protein [Desulfobulbaceae bacterium]